MADTQIEITLMRRQIRAINLEVNRVGTYYKSRKLTATDTKKALDELGISTDQITELLDIWGVDLAAPVRLPTAAQIGKAVQYDTLTTDQGIAALKILGYSNYDAAIVLSAESQLQITPLPPDDNVGVKI